MMTTEHLLSVYIDANIILFTVALIWFLSKFLLAHSPLRSAYHMHLQLLYALIAMVALSPLAFVAIEQAKGLLPGSNEINLSGFLVAQYLEGNIALAPSEFERLLTWRTEITHEIASFSNWMGYLVMGGLVSGFAIALGRNIRDTFALARMIRKSYVLRRMGRVDIRVTHETLVPFSTRSLWRHYVVLPTNLLTHKNDVRIAVSHELQHMRQHDLTWEIALELIRPFFFWNPAFSWCKRDVERLRELVCDQRVLGQNKHRIREYCECLLRVCRTSLKGDNRNQIITPSVPFALIDTRANASHSGLFLRQRILSLLDDGNRWNRQQVTGIVIVFALAITSLATLALRPANDWSHDRIMLSTIVNLERLNSRTITP